MFVGGLVDLLSTGLLTGLLSAYVMMQKGLTDNKPETLEPQIENAIHSSPVLFGIQTALGLGCSILGGYVAARVAKQDEIENAIAASLIFVSLGVYALIAGSEESIWLNAFSTVITPFFYRLGAQARIRELAKKKT